jgi:preprotein translocase SecE subunit
MSEANQDDRVKALGLLRWVQLAYMVLALLTLWVLDKISVAVWSKFAEPNTGISTAVAALVSGVIAFAIYRHEKANRMTREVVAELAKVTWPSGKETQVSTIVVIVTSVIAAVILGAFDAVWSAITDLIYKV